MNQTIKQDQAILHGLRLRTSLATAEMYRRIGRDEPARTSRYRVVPRGKNTFDVIERATGAAKGQRIGHDNACQLAQQLEERTSLVNASRSAIKHLGRWMLRWVLAFSTTLLAFMYFGLSA